jgi:tetratricopeptide (TPR) repeat protein
VICPSDDDLSSYLAGRIPGEHAASIAGHVASCRSCSALVEVLATGAPVASAPTLAVPAASAPTVAARGPRGTTSAEPSAGDAIGSYVLQRRIGAGGMGTVWAAYDPDLDRAVAIKLVRDASPSLRRRFEREVRITARLQHPSIVGIIEAGVWSGGEPYYVMELVGGESFEKLIDAQPTLADRLTLLPNAIAVVDALAAAHRSGVIHRDLKPENVLVGEYGETIVIDWGLAKSISDPASDDADDPYRSPASNETVVGSVMGTPAYMPPEQARGEVVDARADVYALGAMLYYLLSGHRPYADAPSQRLLEAVVAGPPATIMTPSVPPDLATIVAKAMARDAADRYPTAKQLAEDLKRFQAGQLVASHRYSFGQLFRRWLGRHRVAAAVAAIAVVVLGGLGAFSVQRIRQQRTIAEHRRADADELLDFIVYDLRDKLFQIGRLDMLGEVARKAKSYFDVRDEPGDPASRYRRATVMTNLADVLAAEGDTKSALALYLDSLARDEELVASDPAHETWQQALAVTHDDIGDVLMAQGDVAGALTHYRAALAIDERLAAAAPDNTRLQLARSFGHEKISDAALRRADATLALAERRASLAIVEQLAARHPDDTAVETRLLEAHAKVGAALIGHDSAGALTAYRQSIALAEKLAARDPSNTIRQRDLAGYHENIGVILFQQGEIAGSLPEYRAALTIVQRLAERDPTNTGHQGLLEDVHGNLGDALLAMQDAQGALAEYQAALDIASRLANIDAANDPWQRDLAHAQYRVGSAYHALHRRADVEAAYRGALSIAEGALAKHPADADWKSTVDQLRKELDALAREH